MSTYISVTPGIDMTSALDGKRVTKKFLREYLKDNPQKDFRIYGRSSYVNGQECVSMDLVLEVRDPSTLNLAACVSFVAVAKADLSTLTPEQRTQVLPQQVWGYRAVVS